MNELQRPMFQMPTQNQQPQPMGGITSGLDEAEAVESTEALGGIASGIETLFQNIDNAESPKEIMDAIRGAEASVEERRTELGQLVGKADADKTPESVLTIVQPLMTVIESTGGISDLDSEESPVAPNIGENNQMEAMARMLDDQPTVTLQGGSNPGGNPTMSGLQALNAKVGSPMGLIQLAKSLAPSTPSLSSFQSQYEDKPSAYEEYSKTLPYMQLAKFGQILGNSPTVFSAITNPETTKLADPIVQLSLLQAKEKQEREDKATKAFTEAKKSAQAEQTKLLTPVISAIAGKENKFIKLDDGGILKVDTSGNATMFQEGEDKTITVGSTVLQLNKQTGEYKPVYSKPGANTKQYTTDKGSFLIDFDQEDGKGGYKVTSLAGGQTQAEIDSKFFKFISDGSGGGFAIDTRKPTIVNEDTGLTVLNPLFDVQGKDKTSTQSTQAGLMIVNETNPDKSFLVPGTSKKEYLKIGSKETGFKLFNKFDGTSINVPGLEKVKPEFEKDMDNLVKQSMIINNPDQHGNLTVKTAQIRYNALANKLLPPDNEFAKLRDDQAEIFKQNLIKNSGLDGGSIDISNRVEQFKYNLNNDRIEKLTTTATQYDKQKALKTVYSTMVGKLQTDTAERVRNSTALNRLGQLQKLVSANTKTGATAPFRLALGKLLEGFGIKDKVISTLGITEAEYNEFQGGTLANLELSSKIGSQFAVEFASSFPGNLNESEVRLIENAGINLSTTKEGIEVMSAIFRGQAERDKEEQKLINNYMSDKKNSSKTSMEIYGDLEGKLIKYRESNPIVNEEITAKIKGFTAEQPNQFIMDGGSEVFKVSPDRLKRYNLVKASGATTLNEFISRAGPVQQYAKDIYGKNASFSKEQLTKMYNLYSPLALQTNPNYKEN